MAIWNSFEWFLSKHRQFWANQAREDRILFWKKKILFGPFIHDLCLKIKLFSCVFFVRIRPEKIENGQKKNAFYTKKVKKTNLSNRNFPKELVYEFCLKIVLFVICVFWPNQARKHRFLIHWIEKNTFKTRKEKLQKSPQNQTFPKGLNHAFC